MPEIIELIEKDGSTFYEDREKVFNFTTKEFKEAGMAIPLMTKYGKTYLVPDGSWTKVIDSPTFTPEEIRELEKHDINTVDKIVMAKLRLGGSIAVRT